MLKDIKTGETFSSRHDAIRKLGANAFKDKVLNDEIIYVQCR